MSPTQKPRLAPKLSELMANCPAPRQYRVAGAMLSKAEAEDVLRSTDKIHLSDAEKEQYIRSIVHALTSNGIDDEMAKVAEEALKNAKAVENAFGQMALVLGMVDMRYKTTFVLRMYPIFRLYAEVLLDSIQLAYKIAQYGEKFDDEVIPRCADEKRSIFLRTVEIHKCISTAEQFEKDSKGVTDRLEQLRSNFTSLVAEAKGYVDARDGGASARAMQLAKHTVQRKDPVQTFGLDVDLGIPALSLVMSLSTHLASFLTIAGLTALETPAAQNTCLAIGAAVAHAECRPAAESVYASVDEGTSDEVNAYLAAFRKTVDGINQYWLHGLNDAREIEDWLHDGAEMMKYPEYMKMCLEEGAKVYTAMAKYLRGYAQGIEEMHAEKWPVWEDIPTGNA